MKILDLPQGFSTVISNEEHELLQKFDQSPHVLKRNLDHRQQEVARNLSHRGILTRTRVDGKLAYLPPSMDNLWRI